MKLTLKDIIKKRENEVFVINKDRAISFNDFYYDIATLELAHNNDFVALKCSPDYETLTTLFALWANNNTVCLIPSEATEEEIQEYQQQIPFKTILTPTLQKGTFNDIDIDLLDKKTKLIILSSGSSGQSKGIAHGLAQLYWSATGTNSFYKFSSTDHYPLTLPLHHIGGLMIPFRCLLSGAKCEIHEKRSSAIHSKTASILSLVPAQLYDKIKNNDSVSPLRSVLLGGAKCPDKLLKRAYLLDYPISLTYGCSESCSQVYASKPHDKAKGPTDLLPYREAIIKNGYLYIKGNTLMNYYYLNSQKVYPFDDHGFYKTNDLVTDNGFLSFGRKDAMMISGGENIPTSLWEEKLLLHNDIMEAKSIICNDDRMGQIGHLFYQSSASIVKEDLRNYLSRYFSPYKMPKKIIPFPQLGNKIKHTYQSLQNYAQNYKE